MDPDPADIAALIRRDKIRDALARLARGEDRRDAALIRSAYWPDATTDYGVFKGDFPTYLGWVVPGADAITNTQHVLGQSHIEWSGDTARVETQVVSYHRVDMAGGQGDADEQDTCIGGRYLDVFACRDGEWRIASRVMLYDWFQNWGPAIDWSQGVMGLPFAGPHYPGRARDDHSLTFFADGAAAAPHQPE